MNYLIKILITLMFSAFIVFMYFNINHSYVGNFDWYIWYVIPLLLTYGIHKFITINSWKKELEFSLYWILWYFLLNLFILCLYFYHILWLEAYPVYNWIYLFFKIIWLSIIPLIIVFLSIAFWKKLLNIFKLDLNKNITSNKNSEYGFNFILSIWLGFFSFLFLLTILWLLVWYNLIIVLIILLFFTIYSFNEIKLLLKSFIKYRIKFENHDLKSSNLVKKIWLKLLTTEFLVIVIITILAVNLISIVRPFPIWWDDLGVYMNFPRQMANSASIDFLSGMYSWQVLTWIGFMIFEPVQAFFLNSIWWFLSVIIIILVLSDLLKSFWNKLKETFINIPLLISAIFISLPMVVFQQAKDMKVDEWLFFISVIVFYLIAKICSTSFYNSLAEDNLKDSEDVISNKKYITKIIFIIWILAWFAFSIKFTSLLLISAIIGTLFYLEIGFVWFLWYLSIFFAVFTKLGLWIYLNVSYPKENLLLVNNFSIISFILWIVLLSIWFYKHKKQVIYLFKYILIFILWILLAISPWIGKNIYQAYKSETNISLGVILSWKSDSFKVDYLKIYTKEELKEIKEKIQEDKQKEKDKARCIAWNEDLCRYFGYEKWINNFIKLPYNLTMQTNQWGEFTNIWWLFLALLPALLLFLNYRKKYYAYFIVLILFLELIIFFKAPNNLIEKEKLNNLDKNLIEEVFIKNPNILKDKIFNKDIYDINIDNYILYSDIEKFIKIERDSNNYKKEYDKVYNQVVHSFYNEIAWKVISNDETKKLKLINNNLLINEDYNKLKILRELYNKNYIFNSNITWFSNIEDKIIKKYWLEEKTKLLELWNENRTINQFITDNFSKIKLPFGYLIILALFLLPTIYFIFTLKNTKLNNLFKVNIIFSSFYIFLWTISAFWIVWYWILMYFSLLLMIAIALYNLSSYDELEEEMKLNTKFVWSLLIFTIFILYFLFSVYPYTFDNIKKAWYISFKTWDFTAEQAIFKYHPEYKNFIFNLNIDYSKIKKDLTLNITDILYPSKELANNEWVYRIGTFLKYYINNNNSRLYEDSLLKKFYYYIYDKNSIDNTIKNIKDLWIKHILVDLNAATIDKDPEHKLTNIYTNLLKVFTSDKLKLVDTDNTCLKVALEDYSKSKKTKEDLDRYISLSSVNINTYNSWKILTRTSKINNCINRISYIIYNNQVNKTDYKYLSWLFTEYNKFLNNKNNNLTEQQVISFISKRIKPWSKALFEIK